MYNIRLNIFFEKEKKILIHLFNKIKYWIFFSQKFIYIWIFLQKFVYIKIVQKIVQKTLFLRFPPNSSNCQWMHFSVPCRTLTVDSLADEVAACLFVCVKNKNIYETKKIPFKKSIHSSAQPCERYTYLHISGRGRRAWAARNSCCVKPEFWSFIAFSETVAFGSLSRPFIILLLLHN